MCVQVHYTTIRCSGTRDKRYNGYIYANFTAIYFHNMSILNIDEKNNKKFQITQHKKYI